MDQLSQLRLSYRIEPAGVRNIRTSFLDAAMVLFRDLRGASHLYTVGALLPFRIPGVEDQLSGYFLFRDIPEESHKLFFGLVALEDSRYGAILLPQIHPRDTSQSALSILSNGFAVLQEGDFGYQQGNLEAAAGFREAVDKALLAEYARQDRL